MRIMMYMLLVIPILLFVALFMYALLGANDYGTDEEDSLYEEIFGKDEDSKN